MKDEFILASIKDKKIIYDIWYQTGKRIFGLMPSIKNKNVWVFKHEGEVNGFCRYNDAEGVRLDHIKFYELMIDAVIGASIYKNFFNVLDGLILGLGFHKARAVAVNERMHKLLTVNGWNEIENRFTVAKTKNKIYTNFIFERNLSEMIKNKNMIKKFGKLIEVQQ